jgi:RNA polymerase sigma-70 factor (ECF subfamily)
MTSKIEDEIDKAAAENLTPVDPRAEDRALVAAAKSGDGRAFGVLVGRHQSRIRAIASRFTRVPEDAEDIAQQSFQKAFIHLRQFEGNSAFSTWLTRITINEALMWLRKKRAALEVPIEESTAENGTTPALDSPDPGPSPEDSYLQREWKQILSLAMNHLTPATRKTVELRHLSELSTDETAGIMKLSTGAVKARIFHGRRKLRALLKDYAESTRSRGNHAMPRNSKAKRIPKEELACSACD